MAEFRGELNEAGVIVAVCDINDFYYEKVGSSYLKNRLDGVETSKVFLWD